MPVDHSLVEDRAVVLLQDRDTRSSSISSLFTTPLNRRLVNMTPLFHCFLITLEPKHSCPGRSIGRRTMSCTLTNPSSQSWESSARCVLQSPLYSVTLVSCIWISRYLLRPNYYFNIKLCQYSIVSVQIWSRVGPTLHMSMVLDLFPDDSMPRTTLAQIYPVL